MSDPVRSASSTNVNVNFSEVESEPITLRSRTPSQPQESQVESWSGQQPIANVEPNRGGAVSSGQALAAQSAREAAERKASLKALGALDESLAKLAKKHPDPLGFFGFAEFKNKDVSLGAFGAAVHAETFEKAVGVLTPRDVRESVEAQVKKAWPKSTPEQAKELTNYFMSQICESLRERVAPKLQEAVTKKFEHAASDFRKATSDPAQLEQLAARLNEMTPGDQPSVRNLRAGLGLDPDRRIVTPDRLAVALGERAALLEEEAHKMKVHARPTLFRSLAKQDLEFAKQAGGIGERSLMSEQIDMVKVQGESEQDRITYAKYASAFVAGGFVAGMGLGGAAISEMALGVGVTSSAIAVPTAAMAWEEVGTAQASESAGTMKAGAGEEARNQAVVETSMAVAAVAGGAVLGKGLHVLHAAPELAQIGAHAFGELGVEYVSHQVGHAVNDAMSSDGEASGRNALERLKP